MHRGAICQFPVRWIYYCHSNKSTGKKTGKTQLCAVVDLDHLSCCNLNTHTYTLLIITGIWKYFSHAVIKATLSAIGCNTHKTWSTWLYHFWAVPVYKNTKFLPVDILKEFQTTVYNKLLFSTCKFDGLKF